ncbi:Solute carrier family 13 [Dillenia turbinata]|uniref:Solute carrier family 13 n=1 Tax=Dillenia turbinata TaxID=194707 RepID=A0AAN8V2W0_9MAGN
MASLALTSSSLNLRFRSFHHNPHRSRPLLKSQPLTPHLNSFRSKSPFSNNLNLLSRKPLSLSLKPKSRPNFIARASASASASVPAPVPAPPPPAPAPWTGAAIKPLIASIATGVILWFVPVPAGVSRNAWQLLSIFLATIVGIITQPLPLGAVALMGLGASVLTKTLTFSAAFSAFGDPIPWLIALAFFFARGFIKTGLGNRIAYQFVSLFGSSSLGLGYSLVFSEALLAPAIPSVSARAGGIFLPLVKSLCAACGSNVGDGTEHKLGSWLMLTCFQTSVISSSMFLTAMAANPLSANLTFNTIKQTIGWTDWAKAAIVPGLVSLVVVPLLLYVIYPPTVKSSPDAPKLAREKLEKMGPMSKNEIIMAGTLLLTASAQLLLGCYLRLHSLSLVKCKDSSPVRIFISIHCLHPLWFHNECISPIFEVIFDGSILTSYISLPNCNPFFVKFCTFSNEDVSKPKNMEVGNSFASHEASLDLSFMH